MNEVDPRPVDDTKISLRELPDSVVAARLDQAQVQGLVWSVAEPRIKAVLGTCRTILQDLEDRHRRFAEITDLDLSGYSRGSALWLLSGRLIGLHRALLILIDAGIDSEALVTGRAIHEGARVLYAFGVPDADDLVRTWLDDQGRHGYVKQRAAREAQDRFEKQVDDALKEQGLPSFDRTSPLTEELYDQMSRAAHNRRSSCLEGLNDPARRFSYGVQQDPFRRGESAIWAASMTGEIINSVGDALRALYGTNAYFAKQIAPLFLALHAVRDEFRLDRDSLVADAGLT